MQSISQHKYIKRFILAIVFIIIAFIFLEVFATQASASNEGKPPKPNADLTLQNKAQKQSLQKFISTTTSTTTTTVPKKKTVAVTAGVTPNTTVEEIPQPTYEYPGSPQDWMREAGIPESDWEQAELLVSREGGWRPCVRNGGVIDCNYNGSAAYGIPQSLPGSKMSSFGDDWRTNPVTQLKWMKSYVEGRYGGWAQANRAWESRCPKCWY
jgi:hypothetical protein